MGGVIHCIGWLGHVWVGSLCWRAGVLCGRAGALGGRNKEEHGARYQDERHSSACQMYVEPACVKRVRPSYISWGDGSATDVPQEPGM